MVQVTAVLVLFPTVAVKARVAQASSVAVVGLMAMVTAGGGGAVTVTVAVLVPAGVATLVAVTTYVPGVAGAT
jgi:hypothetical protein